MWILLNVRKRSYENPSRTDRRAGTEEGTRRMTPSLERDSSLFRYRTFEYASFSREVTAHARFLCGPTHTAQLSLNAIGLNNARCFPLSFIVRPR